MLYDILLALTGHNGDVIIQDGNSYKVGTSVNITYSDLDMVNSITKLGYQYSNIRKFCDDIQQRRYNSIVDDIINGSKYKKSLNNRSNNNYILASTHAIEKYLQNYLENIINIQSLIKANPNLSLATLLLQIQNQKDIINTITKIINEVCLIKHNKSTRGPIQFFPTSRST